jgi:PAS domain S-box-containing protein
VTFVRRLVRWASAHLQALGLSFLLVVFAAAVFWFFASFVPDRREAAVEGWRRELSLRADHERDLLERRILDVTEDLRFFAALPSVRGLLAPGLSGETVDVQAAHLQRVLSDYRHLLHQRSVSTLDASGRVRASGGGPAPGAAALALAADVISSGAPKIALVREPDGVTGLVHAMPVTGDEAGAGQLRILGAVLAVGDASTLLFDLLGQPVAASSSESLLVREDGTDVLFLSPLHFRPDPPLSFRLPLKSAGLAAGAALSEKEGFRAFVDYRGAKVFAALRRIANTPWGLVVKVDEDEALAAFRKDMLQKGITWGALLVGLSAGAVGLWRSLVISNEIKVARSEARFGALVEQATDAIFLVGSDGRVLQANRAAEVMYGWARDELFSMHAADVRASGTRDALRHDMETAAARGSLLVETRHRRADGSEFPVEVNLGLVKAGDETLFLSIVRDITARKTAEDRIRALNRLLRTISEVNQLLVRGADEESLPKDVCRILVSHGGYALAWVGRADTETMRVMPVASAGDEAGYLQRIEVRWDDTPEGRGPLGIAIREGRSVIVSDVQADPMVVPWRRLHPSPGFGSIAAIPIRRGGAVTAGLIVYSAEKAFIDAEELALLEELAGNLSFALDALDAREALRESEERYRALFGGMMNGFAYCEMLWEDGRPSDFIYLAANRAFGELTGLKDVVGRRVSDVIPGLRDLDPQLFETFGRVASTGIPETLETYVQALGIWFSIAAYSPKKGLFVVVFDNISERKKAEAALLETQQQLAQSQKMEAVGRLAGGVAHDFNNLLTVIQGYGELLQASLEGDPEKRESVVEIVKAAERAAALTRQLLAFSRKQTLVPGVLDMGDVVSGLSTMVERLIGEDVKVSVVVSPNLGRVKADRGQLEQVVMNLAVNARDAMPGGGSLTVALADADLEAPLAAMQDSIPPGRYVVLSVTDTGTGMDAETVGHLFEPFFTTKMKGKGTGLGLATVYGIVRQTGGYVAVETAPGAGTTFRIYLPRCDEPMTSGIRPAVASHHGTETVLLVEDEPAVRALAKVVLERRGYAVLVAESGAAALDVVTHDPRPIHVLLTDLVMPGMNGRQLASRVAALRPSIKVVFMSGYAADVVRSVDESGASGFLAKPFTQRALTAKIREVLDAPLA